MVLMAISLLTLTGVGGIAVDVGHWYWKAQHLQRAADAAALAAVPHLPGDVASANKAALQELKRNGIGTDNWSNTKHASSALTGEKRFEHHVYLAPDASHPNRMRVEVGITLKSFFVGLIGHHEQDLTRSSISSYKAKVPMGSPSQALGAEPGNDDVTPAHQKKYNGKYWLNISGGATDKIMGDRYTAGTCKTADRCDSGKNEVFPYGKDNGRSHRYIVHVPKGSGPVAVQVYDGAFVHVGDHCDENTELAAAEVQAIEPVRYAVGAANEHCTGDTVQGGGARPAPATTFTVHAPTDAKGKLGTVLKSTTFPAVKANGDTSSNVLLNELNKNPGSNGPTLRNTFRKWYTVTTLNGPGDYVIEAKTASNAYGANRFSLRVGTPKVSGPPGLIKGLTISSAGHLTVFTNADTNDTSFYFAKLTSATAGRTLKLNLYDIGDTSGANGVTLQLRMPTGNNSAAKFESCVESWPEHGYTQNRPTCTIPNAKASTYNGKDVVLEVKVPESYSCDDFGGDECWMALRFILNGASDVSKASPSQDTTTWEILDCGRPIRLVNEHTTDDDCPAL